MGGAGAGGGGVKGLEGWAVLLTALAEGSANVTPQKWQDWFTPVTPCPPLSHLFNTSTTFLIVDGQRKRNVTIQDERNMLADAYFVFS